MRNRPSIVHTLLAVAGLAVCSSSYDADDPPESRREERVGYYRTLLADIAAPEQSIRDLPDGVRRLVDRQEPERS